MLDASVTQTIAGTAKNAVLITLQVDGGPSLTANGTDSWSVVFEPGSIAQGSRTLTARAADSRGNVATASITVTVQLTSPPMGTFTYISSVDGTSLTGIVHVGANYNPAQPTGLVMFLHGGGGNGTLISNMLPELDSRGWIGIAPNGRLWNLYNQGCPWQWSAAYVDNPDPDVGPGETDMLDAIAWARATYNIDPTRIYLTGFSMGGRGTYQIGLRNPDVFAAIAPMAPAADMYEIFVRRPEPSACKEGMTGGRPGDSAMVDTYYTITSGRFLIENAHNLPVYHAHGTTDTVAYNVSTGTTYLHGYHVTVRNTWNGAHGGDPRFDFGHTPTLSELRAAFPAGYDWAYFFTDVAHQVDGKWFTNQQVGTAGTVEGTADPLNPGQYLGMFQFFERRTLLTNPQTVVYKSYTNTHRRAYWTEIDSARPWEDIPAGIVASRTAATNCLEVELARIQRATFDLGRARLVLASGMPLTVNLHPLNRPAFDPALNAAGEALTPRIALRGNFASLSAVNVTFNGTPVSSSLITQTATEITIGPLPQINGPSTLVVTVP